MSEATKSEPQPQTIAERREELRARVLARMDANDLRIERHRILVRHDGTKH